MAKSRLRTPGVYINEINAFPNSVVPVETAIPAFIGYTPQANYQGKSLLKVVNKISSFTEFKTMYGYPDLHSPADPTKQYSPAYYLVKQKSQPKKGEYILIDGDYYSILPDPNTIYYLFNSIQLFYENGGEKAYIVSVGTYQDPSKKPINPLDQLINPNIKLNDLLDGLKLLKNELEPTMYSCPDATLLSRKENSTLMQRMLKQNSEMGNSISLFDIIGADNPDPTLYVKDIESFRSNIGVNGLNYGAAYYPFIETSILQTSDIDYTNLFGGNLNQLEFLINPPKKPNSAVKKVLEEIRNSSSKYSVSQLHDALLNASHIYSAIVTRVLKVANLLPTSGAIAGVIALTDNESGVWKAPANVSINGATDLPIKLTDQQQENLNIDPSSGKSINAIRFFQGRGIFVWGARTLAGNNPEWKYLSVSRTIIYLKQSCKLAVKPYVFEPNDKNTWNAISSMISNFLNSIWREGGLQGMKESDAYFVQCGLGSTMTSSDILNGTLHISIGVALLKPAEFMVFSIEEKLASSI